MRLKIFHTYYRLLTWLALMLSLGTSFYCILAVVMVASLSGAPNYSLERAKWNEHIWGLGFLASALVSSLCVWLLVRSRRGTAH